jgi:hypothetical protein
VASLNCLRAAAPANSDGAKAGKLETLLRFFMSRVLPAKAAILVELEPLARLFLVLRRAVVAALTFVARQRDDVSHYSILRDSVFAGSLFGSPSNGELRTAIPIQESR